MMSGVVPVLLYHSVSDQLTGQFGPYTVSRLQLASHLDQVTGLGFSTPAPTKPSAQPSNAY